MGSSTGKCSYFKWLWWWFLWFWLFAVELNLMISTETCRSPRSSMDNAVSGRDLMPQLRWGWQSQHWERSSREGETARSEVAQMLNFSKDWKSYFYAGSFCFGRSINCSGRGAKIFYFFPPHVHEFRQLWINVETFSNDPQSAGGRSSLCAFARRRQLYKFSNCTMNF